MARRTPRVLYACPLFFAASAAAPDFLDACALFRRHVIAQPCYATYATRKATPPAKNDASSIKRAQRRTSGIYGAAQAPVERDAATLLLPREIKRQIEARWRAARRNTRQRDGRRADAHAPPRDAARAQQTTATVCARGAASSTICCQDIRVCRTQVPRPHTTRPRRDAAAACGALDAICYARRRRRAAATTATARLRAIYANAACYARHDDGC